MKYYMIDYSGDSVIVFSRYRHTEPWRIEASFINGETAEAYVDGKAKIATYYRCVA